MSDIGYAECSGECDECEYRRRISRQRGWSIPEFFEEDITICTLEAENERE